MAATNSVGKLGEYVVGTWFGRRLNNKFRFSVAALGEKYELLDFTVDLLDDNEKPFGPHFTVQVKCTSQEVPDAHGIPAPYPKDAVDAAIKRKVPVYLVGVLLLDDESEEVYILAVDKTAAKTGKGIGSVPRRYSLKEPSVREAIYDEVCKYFDSIEDEFESKLIRDTTQDETDDEEIK